VKILVVGYFGSGNCGDELILSAMHARWCGRAGSGVVLCATRYRAEESLPQGVRGVDVHNVFAVVDAVADSDLVVLGGGGLLQDKRPPELADLASSPCWSLAAYLRPLWLAHGLGIPTRMVGVGAGPLTSPLGRRLAARSLEMTDHASLRDEASLALARHLAPEASTASGADLVWAHPGFAPQPDPASDGRARRDLLLLNLRSAELMPGFDAMQVARTVRDFARTHDLVPMFVPFHRGSDYADDRVEAMLRDHGLGFQPVPASSSPADIARLWQRAALSVGARYHAAVVAALHDVPHVALAYDEKVCHVMAELGARDRCLTTGDGLRATLSRVWANRAEISGGIGPQVEPLRRRAREALDDALDAIAGPEGVVEPRGASPATEGPSADEPSGSRAAKLGALFQRHGHRYPEDIARSLQLEVERLEREVLRLETEHASLRRQIDSTPAGRLFRVQNRVARWVKARIKS